MVEGLNSDVAHALERVGQGQFKHVFLVACGGSLSIMHPAKYLLDRYAVSFCSDLYNADEFVCRQPRRLGKDALVVLCSQTGATRETVGAAGLARDLGATTIAMTVDRESSLAVAADHVIQYRTHYTTGVPIDAAESNYSIIYMLLCGLLAQRGDAHLLTPLLRSLPNLQGVIDRAKLHYALPSARYAERFRGAPVIYTTAAGAAFGAAYSYAICVLMEMQWINSQAIHANEFFHGPFEVVDKSACFIALARIGRNPAHCGADQGLPASLRRSGQCDAARRCRPRPGRVLNNRSAASSYRSSSSTCFGYSRIVWRSLRGQAMLEGRRYMKKITDY